MGDENKSMRAALRCIRIMVAADQLRNCLCQITRKRGTIRRRGKTYFRIDGKGSEMLVGFTSASPKIADLSHDASTECDQITRGKPILAMSGISRSSSQGFR